MPDSSQPALVDMALAKPERWDDLSIAAYILDSASRFASVEDMAARFLGSAEPFADDAKEPQPEDAAMAANRHGPAISRLRLIDSLHQLFRQRLGEDGSMDCYRSIEMPLVCVLVRMERDGVSIDPDVLTELGDKFALTLDSLRARAWEIAGEQFNLDSPKQLGQILFDKLNLPTQKKTRTGYSTDASVLQELAGASPLPSLMLEYRELAKLKSTYLDTLPKLLKADGRIHTTFHQTVAATGRLSSSDPNLQNIPVRTDLGRLIRTAFVADPQDFQGEQAVLLSADYSQIELRLLAHLSGDERLISAFREGEDFHAATAAQVFGVAVADVTPQMRSRAKAVNFGIVYGQQAYGLSQSLQIPFAEAQQMIDSYFMAYPQVQEYLRETVRHARDHGWVQTMFGRKRHIHELASTNANTRNFGERTAMNHPMQGSAADIIKLAMIEVQRRLDAEGFKSKMVLQVHDELDFNCAVSEAERLARMVREAMEGVASLKAPLKVEVNVADNWADAH